MLKGSERIRYTQHVGEEGGGRTSDWVKIKTEAGKEIDVERAKWNE